jgi:2'-5' RNA ligase
MRLFVGVELVGPSREEILAVREKLVEALSRQGVRFVRPDKIHLTLSFLGDVDEDRLDDLKAALRSAATRTAFEVQVGEIGCFPDPNRPKVIWMGLQGEIEKLELLAAEVTGLAKPFASHHEEKPYSPHITLARISPGSKVVGRLLQAQHLIVNPAIFPIDSVTLFQSHPDGSYVVLERIGLARAMSKPS